MDHPTLNTIGLCSGVGMLEEGVHAGLEFLGIRSRTVLYAEREAFPASNLAARMEEGILAPAPIWFGDFTKLPAKRFRGMVDGVVAGFPCQDLSIAGRRAGLDGKRSGLFFSVLDVADDCGAWFLVLENVSGIATATASVVDETEGHLEERAAARVMGELADRGWNAEWITLSASDVGASHGRARWFCFAWREELDDSTRDEWNGLKREAWLRRGIRQAGDTLDDAKGDERLERWTEPSWQQGRSDASEHGRQMADAASLGRKSRPGLDGTEVEMVGTCEGQFGAFDLGSDVADACGTRPQGIMRRGGG